MLIWGEIIISKLEMIKIDNWGPTNEKKKKQALILLLNIVF